MIKNIDWYNNPVDFIVKNSIKSDPVTISIKSVKSFEVYGDSKYIRKEVKIDKHNSNDINNLSLSRKLKLENDVLFLKVISEGDASLYEWKKGNINKYFIETENSEIEQLVFKLYSGKNREIKENNRFKQQLLNKLKCSSINYDRVKNLKYKLSDLSKFFDNYNLCKNPNLIIEKKENRKGFLNYSIRPGISFYTYDFENIDSFININDGIELDNETGFRFGFEIAYVLPFNKNKW